MRHVRHLPGVLGNKWGIRSGSRMVMAEHHSNRPAAYSLRDIEGSAWGKELHGLDVKKHVCSNVIEQLKADVDHHRLVILRNQGVISGERHVEISGWFGALESTFYKHPASPHPDIFRVSNVRDEGCTGVGRTGWHIDGSFQCMPFHYSTYHIVSPPKQGSTVFAPLEEVVNVLPEQQRARWDRLSMVSNRQRGPIHPVIYTHPVTGKQTMCFHTGMTAGFIWDHGTPEQRVAGQQEACSILQEIDTHFRGPTVNHLIYNHHWREGDFIITDNLAVAHEATADSQLPVSEVGLRVMHRTTVAGTSAPTK